MNLPQRQEQTDFWSVSNRLFSFVPEILLDDTNLGHCMTGA